jgi:hypothetical protein
MRKTKFGNIDPVITCLPFSSPFLENSFIVAASKNAILKMIRKPETEGTLQTEHRDERPAMTVTTLHDVLQRLQSLH